MTWTPAEAKKRKAEILAALQAAGGNVSKTAEALGVSRGTLYTHVHMLGLERAFGLDGQPKALEPLPPSEARCAVTVKLPEALWQWVRIRAIQEKTAASALVERALERLRVEIESKGK